MGETHTRHSWRWEEGGSSVGGEREFHTLGVGSSLFKILGLECKSSLNTAGAFGVYINEGQRSF